MFLRDEKRDRRIATVVDSNGTQQKQELTKLSEVG